MVRLLVELYGEGLSRVVDTLTGHDELLRDVAADDLVGSLLIVHGLHPVPLEERVTAALDSVRPYLGSHAGGVEIVEIGEDGVLRLRLQGNCDGCGASSETVRVAIENAVTAAAPEIVAVEAEGMVERAPRQQLLQIQPYRSAEPAAPTGWHELADPPPLSVGELAAVELAGFPVLLARTEDQRYAYRNACAACAGALDGGRLEGPVLRCPACASAYDLGAAGRGVDSSGQLDPLPLITDARGVRIAVPQPVPS